MKLEFISNGFLDPQFAETDATLNAYFEQHQEFLDEENPVFGPDTYQSVENIRLSLRLVNMLANWEAKYSYKLQTKFSENALEAIKQQPEEKQIVLLEALAVNTAHILNNNPRPRLGKQSVAIIKKIQEEQLLPDFFLKVSIDHYNDAERILNNASKPNPFLL